ncbi:YggT family protein [Sutcliffiella horikoshii]|uniref:YggT family protein n=1 Tax=Sutcliffiella horikoshii TaxID=79883 RepID=A0A1Y0CM67_9BACI|nr:MULTISPECIES: YggT family protein [Bacillaceae]ART76272.1 YggT family protein [Sutcliffiella horikoshii]TYS72772.1 YggT family protein [Sutcliffiella horikoshii]
MDVFFRLLNDLVFIYTIALIIYIFMSWFPGARESSFGRILGRICEPYLDMFRRIIPPLGMIDISPIVAIFVLRYAVLGLAALFRMLGLY